jgi:hypothetical protein
MVRPLAILVQNGFFLRFQPGKLQDLEAISARTPFPSVSEISPLR